jgi:hypothetical protein
MNMNTGNQNPFSGWNADPEQDSVTSALENKEREAPPRNPSPEPTPGPVKAKKAPRILAPVKDLQEGKAAKEDATVHIPYELRKKLDETRGEFGLTMAERFVNAFNRQYANLPELFGHDETVRGPMPTERSTRRRRAGNEGTVQLRIRLSPEQKQLMQQTLDQYNTNRSVFVTRIFEADLEETRASQTSD